MKNAVLQLSKLHCLYASVCVCMCVSVCVHCLASLAAAKLNFMQILLILLWQKSPHLMYNGTHTHHRHSHTRIGTFYVAGFMQLATAANNIGKCHDRQKN